MKKLLGATLACGMGLVFACSFAACDTNNDAEIAEKAINSVKVKYIDDAVETPNDYTVIGQTKVAEGTYPITWTVSTAETGYSLSDYVTVGTMNETTKMVTVSVTKADFAIEYTLTAAITVGSVTKTVDFSKKVPAKPVEHDGTLANPYSVANVVDIASKMTPKDKLEESDNPVAVYVKGYIVDCGSDDSTNKRAKFVYIVDEYSPTKDKNSPDALLILSINYGTVLTSFSDLEKGVEIVVKGYIMNYQKPDSTTTQPEVTYYGANGVTCEVYNKVQLTDAEKVAAAKAAVDLTVKSYSTEGQVVTLPSTSNGASLSWAVKGESSRVTVSGNSMTVVSIPSEAATVTLTVTITSGSETDTKDIDITVVQASVITVAQAKTILNGLSSGTVYQENGVDKQVFVHGYVTVEGTAGTYGLNNVYIADSASASQDDSVLIYSVNWNDLLPKDSVLDVGDEITVRGYLKDYQDPTTGVSVKEIAQSGSPAVYPEITEITKVVLTDAQKAAKALKLVTLPTSINADEDLPVSRVDGVTLSFSSDNAAIAIETGKMKVTRGTDDVSVTVTVTATIGDVTKTKDFTVVVQKVVNNTNGATFSFESVTDKGATLTDATALTLFNTACGDSTLLSSVAVTKVFAGNGTGGGDYENKGGFIKFGTSSVNGKLVLTFNTKKVTKVTISCTGWKTTDKISVNGTASSALDALGTAKDVTFTLDTATSEITIESTVRAIVFSITVEFEAA